MDSLFPDSESYTEKKGLQRLNMFPYECLSTDEYNGDIYICYHRDNRIQNISEIF